MELELEVTGRHALLFDDDANASFVNSKEALVEWNSLLIDRYDVRHLILNPPQSFRNLRSSFDCSYAPVDDPRLGPELDLERYRDLASASSREPEVEAQEGAKDAGGYRAVPFSYGDTDDSTGQKNLDVVPDIPSFRPQFPVPEHLLQNMPPTEKLHQIIARTAKFVGEHGGQSEIVLRVKQGDNPTFGFLMPHHHLHPYFRYLVDHPELLKADKNGKSQDENSHENQTSGALSLLGSVYGSGEDEDGAAEVDTECNIDSGETSAAEGTSKPQQLGQTVASGNLALKDDIITKLAHPPKIKANALSKNHISIKPAYANGVKRDRDILNCTASEKDKSKASSLSPITKAGTLLVDPPSEVKRLVDRIVEIILKNGKDFETVLIEQDKKHGKFSFLLPSNRYHPFYLKVLKKAQESRLGGKNFSSEKDDLSWQEAEKKAALVKETDSPSPGCGVDTSLDCDRKEKFKMVLAKSKKDSQEQPSKDTQQQCGIRVDAAAAAAILQAATRGIKRPGLNIFSRNGTNPYSNNEQAPASSLSHQSSQTRSSSQKQNENSKPSFTVKEIAKTAALAAANEADSSEAGLTKEQKLKAERLRRAKMFAALVKSGAAPLAKERSPAVSVDLPTKAAKEREGSSVPVQAGTSGKIEKSERNSSDNEDEQKSRKRRHYRSRKHNESEGEEEEDEEKRETEDEEEQRGRRSRKKHKSHRSSRHHRDRSKDRHKYRGRHSSSKGKESQNRHKHESSSEVDDDTHLAHKHESSSEDEHKHHKRRHRHDNSSDDERRHRKRKHRRSRKDEERERKSRKDEKSQEAELEEGEIRAKSSDHSLSNIDDDRCRESSVDVSKSLYPEKRTPSLPPSETTEVPDELRAKIRAMLLATM